MKTFTLIVALLIASPVFAVPPEVPSAPIKCAVGEDTVITVKVAAGKRGSFRPGFRPDACLFFRGYSPDESVMTFLVRPKVKGIHTAVFWTLGEDEQGSSIVEIDAGPKEPDTTPPVVVKPDPTVPPTDKATAATYVTARGLPVPPPVLAAIDDLNTMKGILATIVLHNTTDGTGDVPAQYKVAFAAAKEAGLPALVVTAGDKVLRVVKAPKTEADVTGAIAP